MHRGVDLVDTQPLLAEVLALVHMTAWLMIQEDEGLTNGFSIRRL